MKRFWGWGLILAWAFIACISREGFASEDKVIRVATPGNYAPFTILNIDLKNTNAAPIEVAKGSYVKIYIGKGDSNMRIIRIIR